jgi:drug/metabolite transporter (DMT)-like permease
VLVSAISFGTLAILAKLGYRAGLDAQQIVTFRFVIGALGMLPVTAAFRQNPLRLPPRALVAVVLMGAVGYVAQSSSFILALQSLPASLVELLAYTYPAIVVLAGRLLFGRRLPATHLVALVGSFAGVVLLVGAVRFATGPALFFALVNPVIYTAYLLVGERVMRGLPPVGAATLTINSTAVSLLLLTAATGNLRLPSGLQQWAVLAGLGVVSTMIAITALLAALPRIGAARAALISTVEPVWTVALAVVLLGDRLSASQVAGAILVLASVVLLQLGGRLALGQVVPLGGDRQQGDDAGQSGQQGGDDKGAGE